MQVLFFILLFPLSFAAVASEKPELYTMTDLEVLEAEKNYDEFFLHARDVRPSLRNDYWKKMVANMAESYTQGLLKKSNVDAKIIEKLDDLLDWPMLKENEFFRKNRGDIGHIYFKNCMNDPSKKATCLNELVRFWNKSPKDFQVGFKLGSLLIAHDTDKNYEAWSFFSEGLKLDIAEFYCKDETIQKVIWDRLSNKLNEAKPDIQQVISSTMHKSCWKIFKEEIKKALYSSSDYFRNTAYQLLKAQNELTQEDKDFYATLYLLNGPVVGDTFNEAWTIVTQLGQDHKRREQMLSKIKTIDPLPDQILASFDETKRKVILSFISKNIPEYLDHYAHTCLDFVQGTKDFPNGNPTVRCRDLIKQAEGTAWVDQNAILQYKKLNPL